jgi:hypothetical protein
VQEALQFERPEVTQASGEKQPRRYVKSDRTIQIGKRTAVGV